MLKEVRVKCRSGFIATIRQGISKSELNDLHKRSGLGQPYFIGGDVYYFYSLCCYLVKLGIAGANL